jgi:Ca-activated chloride channel family protein
VAVDKLKRADGQVVTVKQPLPLPEGVSDSAVGQAMPAMAPAAPWGTKGMMASRLPEEAYVRKSKATKPSHDVAGGGASPGGTAASETSVTVTLQDVQTKGDLSPAAVKKVLQNEVAKLERCCQDTVKSGLMLPATITLVFTVGIDGKVSADPIGKPPLASQGLESCLAAAFRSLQFPGSQKDATQVTVTLALKVK